MQDDHLDIEADFSHVICDSAEPDDEPVYEHADESHLPASGPVAVAATQGSGRRSDVRMFLFGFGLMVLLGLGWTFLQPAITEADASMPYWDRLKGVASNIAGIPQQKPVDDRGMYSSLDGESNVTDEDASSDEPWQEDAQDDLQDYE